MPRIEEIDENDAKAKALLDELRNAEKKLRDIFDKRDKINEEASFFADERNTFHEQRKELGAKMDELVGKRDAIVAEMRDHKERRNNYQKKAKNLIEAKKVKKGNFMDIGGDVEILKVQINELEQEYETKPMGPEKEKEHLDKIRTKTAELKDLLEKETEMDDISSEVTNLDERIDKLFKLADKEHLEMQRCYDESQAAHNEVLSLRKEMNHLRELGDRKHQEFVKAKERAQSYHEKGVDLRARVMALRDERADIKREERAIIDNQNVSVREALYDDDRLDQAADDAVDILKSKKKLTL